MSKEAKMKREIAKESAQQDVSKKRFVIVIPQYRYHHFLGKKTAASL
jgi:hypothetical protein